MDTVASSELALTAAWMAAVLVNSLKLIGIAQLTGLTRVITGSFAAKEDYELMRARTVLLHLAL